MNHGHIRNLLERQAAGNLTDEQWAELEMYVDSPAYQGLVQEAFKEVIETTTPASGLDEDRWKQLLKRILTIDKAATSSKPSVHRIHFLRRGWFRYAAVITLAVGLGTVVYLVTSQKKTAPTLASDNDNKQLPADIPPGGVKAILSLANGTKIVLDDAANGNLARQGSVQVVKLADGQIAYNLKGSEEDEAVLNTMSTPNGGQYQVRLPDGTKVLLNAASSITYPTFFAGTQRNVKVTGEAYFEVAKDKARPFIVDVDGKSLVEVLGTSFNINSYADEGRIKATLLEGSISVALSSGQPGSKETTKRSASVILKPGQQASIAVATSSGSQSKDATGIIVKSDPDLAQILAWKNGIFDFTGADLKTVMKQLERWYDIKVEYKAPISNEVFKGKMYRNVNLSDVLEMLKKMGVKFDLKGKNLVIL